MTMHIATTHQCGSCVDHGAVYSDGTATRIQNMGNDLSYLFSRIEDDAGIECRWAAGWQLRAKY